VTKGDTATLPFHKKPFKSKNSRRGGERIEEASTLVGKARRDLNFFYFMRRSGRLEVPEFEMGRERFNGKIAAKSNTAIRRDLRRRKHEVVPSNVIRSVRPNLDDPAQEGEETGRKAGGALHPVAHRAFLIYPEPKVQEHIRARESTQVEKVLRTT